MYIAAKAEILSHEGALALVAVVSHAICIVPIRFCLNGHELQEAMLSHLPQESMPSHKVGP